MMMPPISKPVKGHKKAGPKMGRVSTLGMWYFIATLFSPRKKVAPAGTLQKTGGGFCFVMLYT